MIAITIKKCFMCASKHRRPFGDCPLYLKLQEGLRIMHNVMMQANVDSDYLRQLDTLTADHWLAKCDFACGYFESKSED